MSDLSEIYQDRPTHMDSGDSDDSSFQCSSLNSNSESSYSSTRDFFNMETREDSFLENMYQFVTQCLSNEELMKRLKPKKNLNSKNKQISIESSQKSSSLLSSKFIKKPSYESKVQKEINIVEIIISNKIQIALFFLSIIMMILRAQDLSSLNEKRNKQACLSQFDIINSFQIKDCIERAALEINNRSIIQSTKILLFDYNQIFYITIICIALYSLLKSIASTYSIKSFADYWNNYQKIHKLNTSSKVKLTELKSDYLQKQSSIGSKISQNNQKNDNSKKSFNFLGISFNLNFFFVDKNQKNKVY